MNSQSWHIEARHFLLPKSGYTLNECEDAIGINTSALRYAVADGATEAFDSQTWAHQLAHSWVTHEPPALALEDFRSWAADEGQRLHSSWSGLRLSWYAQEKALGGSFAAFVGLQFEMLNGSPPRWQAIALGDSCLVRCRDEEIREALPLADYESFNAAPLLLPSLGSMQEAALSHTAVRSGMVEQGDVFLLLSDAAAAWFLLMSLKRDPARSEFETLLASAREEELGRFFDEQRLSGRIKDDDIAIIRIAFELNAHPET
ncbi:MAG TPA: hypothetical protein VGO91_06730 [Pyrinomonadaceae bacterium]|jgi:hypothetical protein|nr:hypothetical protein [Pyrinomonadaceae bacterium]